jgi:hypothetical protein
MNNAWRTVFLALFLVIPAASHAYGDETASAALRDVENLYGAGEYAQAAAKLDSVMAVDNTLPDHERAQVYLLKARLELAFDRSREIKPWLRRAHAANPELTLDPVKDPPQLVALWEEIKAEGAPATTTPAAAAGPVTANASPSPFWVGVLPLGIGHFDAERYKDGGLFLSTELLVLLAADTLPGRRDLDEADRDREKSEKLGRVAPEIFGATSFLGVYGYELYDMLPDLYARKAGATAKLRYGLSFMPFGVAQAKNGETLKALGLGAVQTMLLTAGTLTDDEGLRRLTLGLFAVSWAYGSLDGVLGHSDAYDPETNGPKVAVLPVFRERARPGAALMVQTGF